MTHFWAQKKDKVEFLFDGRIPKSFKEGDRVIFERDEYILLEEIPTGWLVQEVMEYFRGDDDAKRG